jgi:hypothetical protein
MLAPVLDSLYRFYEGALDRPMTVGDKAILSQDEQVLLDLVHESSARACVNCPERAASALDCALCSTRIMLALTLGPTAHRSQYTGVAAARPGAPDT